MYLDYLLLHNSISTIFQNIRLKIANALAFLIATLQFFFFYFLLFETFDNMAGMVLVQYFALKSTLFNDLNYI